MFHHGDLQSGVTTAIQENKLVTCFIYKDDDVESTTWEKELLPQLGGLLAEKTVLLKVKLHSQEAGFLSAFCPVTNAPSLAVIDNGRVVVKLEAPIDTEQWRTSVITALHSRDGTPTATSTTFSVTGQDTSVNSSTSRSALTEATTTTETSPSVLQSLLPDRASRLEADQATKQAAEKAARVARAEARRKELEAAQTSRNAKGKQPAESSSDLPPKARTDWIREQAKRKDEAKRERERILQQIQSDREERKHKASIVKQSTSSAEPLLQTARVSKAPAVARTCALQIRLIDGSSIRKTFGADQTLQKDVRRWLKETAPSDAMAEFYTFRHLLAPSPSRNIEKAEEVQSLHELGLTPSATLVISPNADKFTAVSSNGMLSLLMRIISTLLGAIATVLSWLVPSRATTLDSAGSTQAVDETIATARTTGTDASSSSTRMRTKTLADSRAEERADDDTAEYYNGNSSAFEGRKDDDAD